MILARLFTWLHRERNTPRRAPSNGTDDALAARDHARDARADADGMWPEVRELSASLRDLRSANHFAELFDETLRRPRARHSR